MLKELLSLAWELDEVHGGTASISVSYDPYEAEWKAKATWHDGATIEAGSLVADDAMRQLERALHRCIAKQTPTPVMRWIGERMRIVEAEVK